MNKSKQLNSPIIPFYKGDEHKAFTLIEIMVWILIVSIVLIWGFKAYSWVMIWKIKLIESTNIQKQSFFFSEKFFEKIKVGWTIDYEEYFNRKVVWITTSSWHYDIPTWFWNYWVNWNVWTNTYWDWFYYCRSKDWTKMTWTGCVDKFSSKIDWTTIVVWNKPQRYWQYSFQFIDYNSNYDADLWDEDWDGNIIWDDDDEYLGLWPKAFSSNEVKEIYLISADKKTRTIFRWNIKDDPDDSNNNCDFNTWNWGCLSTIEFLKLEWKDWWFDHDTSNWNKKWEYDWIVDTWIIDKNFTWWATIIAGSASDTWFWQPLFWKNVNVSDVKFFVYPNKNKKLAWQDAEEKININPYIRIQMTLSPSYDARKWFRWKIPKIKINTTINLTDIYSR